MAGRMLLSETLADLPRVAPQLQQLVVSDASHIDNAIGAILVHLPNLHKLHLNSARMVTDEVIPFIAQMTGLTDLSLQAELITDAALCKLASLSKIRKLDLFQCKLCGDSAIQALAGSLQSLQDLDIGQCRKVSDAGIEALAACQNLNYLYFSRGETFTGVGLGKLTSLTRLWLAYLSTITNAGMATIANLKNLKEFRMNDCENVSDEGILSAIIPLQNLVDVHVESIPSPAREKIRLGVAKASWLPNLKKLFLFGQNHKIATYANDYGIDGTDKSGDNQ